MYRSPYLWKDPDAFRPERFSEENGNADFGGRWAGYKPGAQTSSLYPNEVNADFAFIPFGGGARKCVGDQFAFMEATVVMALLLRSALSIMFNHRNCRFIECTVISLYLQHCYESERGMHSV